MSCKVPGNPKPCLPKSSGARLVASLLLSCLAYGRPRKGRLEMVEGKGFLLMAYPTLYLVSNSLR